MTYLELVNSVLIRLREREVSAVTESAYAKLIGEFVNESKRSVEDAFNWNALRKTLTATTQADIFNYELNTAGARFRVLDVVNDTSNFFMEQRSSSWFNDAFLNATNGVETGEPRYYTFNGVSADGDTQVDIYPIPDGAYTIRFNIVDPQDRLVNNSDVLLIPSEPVVLGAYARAVAERGEDGGISAQEASLFAYTSLNDHIAIEANHFPEELIWREI
jgi:hypothetical protein